MPASKPLAWITGAAGLIGSHLAAGAPTCAPEWRARGITRNEIDLADFSSLRALFLKESPSLVIHCAGLTKSPACEADPLLARKLNVEVTECLARLAQKACLVFFSTDLVFDGRDGNYDETAAPNPLGVYARTKLEAEKIVLSNPGHLVIRTSLNAGTSPAGGRSFDEEMRQAWKEGRTLRLFVDEYRSPIAATATARAVWELARSSHRGLYHVAGSERLSRWEIGKLLARQHPDLDPKIEPASIRDHAGPLRPPDTSLNCAKAQRLLSFPLPGFSGPA